MSPFLYTNIIWGLGGAIIGYLGGTLIGNRRNHLNQTIAGIIILLLVVVSAVFNYKNADALRDSVTCQRSFNLKYRTAIQNQFEAFRLESVALSELLASFTSSDLEGNARAEVFNKYRQEEAKADALRTASPLPTTNNCASKWGTDGHVME